MTERLVEGTEQVVITEDCLKMETEDFIEQYLARHDCLLIPPIRYARGAKQCRILALDADSLTDFYVDLSSSHDVKVETKREIQSVVPDAPLLTVDALLPNLSPRQREVFAAAHRLGYYELPRETTTADVAEVVGIERRTAEDHLRRAEKKMADGLIEYL
jgi:predicted DNA binding protein